MSQLEYSEILVLPDFGVDFPIFITGEGNMAPEQLNWSDSLVDMIQKWNLIFTENCVIEEGWISDEAEQKFVEELPNIIKAIQAENLGVRIVVDTWFSSRL